MNIDWFHLGCDGCNGITVRSDLLTKNTTICAFLKTLTPTRKNIAFSRIYTPQEIVLQIKDDNYEIYDEEGIEKIGEKSLHQHPYG